MNEHLYSILSALITGVFGGMSGWLLSTRQHRRDDFRTILEERGRQVTEQRTEIDQLKSLLQQMERRIDGLEAARDDFPFPMWQTSRTGEYIHVNRHFIDRFLTPNGKTAADVLGLKHEDIWSPAVSTKFRMLNASAMMAHDNRARFDGVDLEDGSGVPVTLLKIPDYSRTVLVGFTGYVIDILPAAPPPQPPQTN